jgi:hypothetical protein
MAAFLVPLIQDQGPKLFMILNIFSAKIGQKLAVLRTKYCCFCKNVSHNIVFYEKRQFFAEK